MTKTTCLQYSHPVFCNSSTYVSIFSRFPVFYFVYDSTHDRTNFDMESNPFLMLVTLAAAGCPDSNLPAKWYPHFCVRPPARIRLLAVEVLVFPTSESVVRRSGNGGKHETPPSGSSFPHDKWHVPHLFGAVRPPIDRRGQEPFENHRRRFRLLRSED